jgi:uncharacterized protein (DUF433 family)
MRDDEAVVEDPEIMSGEPCIKGTRIPAFMIADMRAAGILVEEILRSYPTLTPDLIKGACEYAATHPRPRPAEPIWRKTKPIRKISVPRRHRP